MLNRESLAGLDIHRVATHHQAEHKFSKVMKNQNYLCVDLKTQMKEQDLRVMDCRKGTLFRNEEDKFTFTEKGAHPHEVHQELHWQLLERCKYGKVSANAQHVKLELYIPHEDYQTGYDLADLLSQYVERMGDTLCEVNFPQLIQSIRALKKK